MPPRRKLDFSSLREQPPPQEAQSPEDGWNALDTAGAIIRGGAGLFGTSGWLPGAAAAGIGETLASGVEALGGHGPKSFTDFGKRLGTEMALGMVPAHSVTKSYQLLRNFLRSGGLAAGGNVARQLAAQEKFDPTKVDLKSAGIAGLTGGVVGAGVQRGIERYMPEAAAAMKAAEDARVAARAAKKASTNAPNSVYSPSGSAKGGEEFVIERNQKAYPGGTVPDVKLTKGGKEVKGIGRKPVEPDVVIQGTPKPAPLPGSNPNRRRIGNLADEFQKLLNGELDVNAPVDPGARRVPFGAAPVEKSAATLREEARLAREASQGASKAERDAAKAAQDAERWRKIRGAAEDENIAFNRIRESRRGREAQPPRISESVSAPAPGGRETATTVWVDPAEEAAKEAARAAKSGGGKGKGGQTRTPSVPMDAPTPDPETYIAEFMKRGFTRQAAERAFQEGRNPFQVVPKRPPVEPVAPAPTAGQPPKAPVDPAPPSLAEPAAEGPVDLNSPFYDAAAAAAAKKAGRPFGSEAESAQVAELRRFLGLTEDVAPPAVPAAPVTPATPVAPEVPKSPVEAVRKMLTFEDPKEAADTWYRTLKDEERGGGSFPKEFQKLIGRALQREKNKANAPAPPVTPPVVPTVPEVPKGSLPPVAPAAASPVEDLAKTLGVKGAKGGKKGGKIPPPPTEPPPPLAPVPVPPKPKGPKGKGKGGAMAASPAVAALEKLDISGAKSGKDVQQRLMDRLSNELETVKANAPKVDVVPDNVGGFAITINGQPAASMDLDGKIKVDPNASAEILAMMGAEAPGVTEKGVQTGTHVLGSVGLKSRHPNVKDPNINRVQDLAKAYMSQLLSEKAGTAQPFGLEIPGATQLNINRTPEALQEVLDRARKGGGGMFKDIATRLKGEKGEYVPELMTSLALSLAGGLGGAAAGASQGYNPWLTGLAGAGAGFAAPYVATKGVLSLPQGLPDLSQVRDQIKGAVSSPKGLSNAIAGTMEQLPRVQRSNLLFSPSNLIANSYAGPYGSSMMAGLELALKGDPRGKEIIKAVWNPAKFAKDALNNIPTAEKLVAAGEEGRMEGLQPGTINTAAKMYQAFPGVIMTAGDYTGETALRNAGLAADQAKKYMLTSEPEWRLTRGLQNLRRGTPQNDLDRAVKALGGLMLPFTRTPSNVVEQGVPRMPLSIGQVARLMSKNGENLSGRELLTEALLGNATAGAGFLAGSQLDPETARSLKKYFTNSAGVYSLPMSFGYTLGQARGKGQSQGQTASILARDAMPLPTTQPLEDLYNMLAPLTGGEFKVPRGAIPAFANDAIRDAEQNVSPRTVPRVPTISELRRRRSGGS